MNAAGGELRAYGPQHCDMPQAPEAEPVYHTWQGQSRVLGLHKAASYALTRISATAGADVWYNASRQERRIFRAATTY